jgi:hypothetical protein
VPLGALELKQTLLSEGEKLESRRFSVSEYRIASIGDGPAASALQDADFQRFRRETDDFSVNWQLHSVESTPEYDLRIYSRTSQANYNIWKTWCSIKSIPPKQLYEACMDVEYKKSWDAGVLDCYQVESLDEQSSVIYTATQVSGFLSNRDSCVMRCTRANIDTDEYVTINVSVNHPRCPEKPGLVRTETKPSGYYIRRRQTGATGSEITVVHFKDAKGWTPAWLINSFSPQALKGFMHRVVEAARKYPEYKRKVGNRR